MCGILGGIAVEPFAWLGDTARLDRAIDTLRPTTPAGTSRPITAPSSAIAA